MKESKEFYSFEKDIFINILKLCLNKKKIDLKSYNLFQKQYNHAKKNIEFTGVGFFCNYTYNDNISLSKQHMEPKWIGGLIIESEYSMYGMESIMHIENGVIDLLEVKTFQEPYDERVCLSYSLFDLDEYGKLYKIEK